MGYIIVMTLRVYICDWVAIYEIDTGETEHNTYAETDTE